MTDVTEPECETDVLRTTRASYDALAADYAERIRAEWEQTLTLEQSMLGAFAKRVRADGGGLPVADVGCGPGRVTADLDGLGVTAFGIDLSPRMIELARRAHPGLRFEEGSMTALDVPDGGLGGIVAMYSIIHIPEELLPRVFAEFHRALAPGGHLLLVFQVGDEPLHLTEALGHEISLDFYPRSPDRVAELLSRAGLEVRARLVREPEESGEPPERRQRACLLARKPG